MNKISFKGNFKNGVKNGKGIEFNDLGKIQFEGEYLNGFRYNGKGYDRANNLVYELKNGCGYVKEYGLCNILIFEGNFVDGVKHGKAKEYKEDYNSTILFEGEYFYGKKWNGRFYNAKNSYEIKEGKGKIKSLEFEGEYLNGEMNGKAKEYYVNGNLKFTGYY